MCAQKAQKPKNGGQRMFRLGPKVSLTRRKTGPGGADAAFIKNAETGRLLRLGPQECFLLTQISDGQATPDICRDFADNFDQPIGAASVEAFVAQMQDHGVLVEVEDAEFVDEEPASDTGKEPPKPLHTSTKGEVISAEDMNDEDDPDPELDDLEDSIYAAAPPASSPPPAPQTGETDPQSPSSEPTAPPNFRRTGAQTDNAHQGDTDPAPDTTSDAAGADSDTGAEEPAVVLPCFSSSRAKADAQSETQKAETSGPAEKDAAQPTPPPQDNPRTKPAATPPKPSGVDPQLATKKVRFRDKLDEPGAKPPGMLRLFDPTGLFNSLWSTFGWLRHVDWLIYFLVLFAVLITLNRMSQYGISVITSFGAFSIIGVLFISLLTVNLFSVLIPATVAQRYGAEIRHFGFIFILWVVPRFAVDMTGLMLLNREAKMAYHATALKTRALLFALATVVWAVTRASATMLPDIAFVVSQISLLILLITAFPLLQGDGYKWMANYFNQPMLRQRAFYHVFGLNRKLVEHLPPPTSTEKWAFTVYAIGSALVMGVILSFLALNLTTALEGRFGGTGLVMFLGLLAAMVLWMSVMKRSFQEAGKATIKRAVTKHIAERQAGLPAMAGGQKGGTNLPVPVSTGGALVKRGTTLPGPARGTPLTGVYSNVRKSPWRWVRRGVVVAALIALIYGAFQPYTYETGGDFVILPDQRSKVSARVEGEIVEVYVDEGDIVEAGQPLARLSDLTPTHAVASALAELEKARAVLARLLAGATEEDIQVAREQVTLAETELPFKLAQVERAEQLFERGTIPERELDAFRNEYAVALQALRTAQANLASVEAPASTADIRVAEADIAKLEAELAYFQKRLEEVVIRAPVTGKVVTENVRLVLGQHMEEGALFVEIENHEIARAEVRVPEADIGLVQPGDEVRLKAWASSTVERIGQVISIAPQAEEEEFGRTVRVKTEFDNTNGFFRPGMTGYAKIDGEEMKSWQAFTRLVDRFFRIEVWGWIP